MTFAGNWLFDTFHTPLAYAGHERNFQAYVSTLTIQPGKSRSLLHFVVLGARVTASTSASTRMEVESTAAALAAAPDLRGLTTAEVCTIHNFDAAALASAGFDYDLCRSRRLKVDVVAQPRPPQPKRATTRVKYDVVEKTIGELRADMEAGKVTAAEITQAYLDRIEYYDRGQFGFNAFEIVAADALAQARAADVARRRGKSGPLLGIPIAIKNNYDTFDMPTTNGSYTFAGPAAVARCVSGRTPAGRRRGDHRQDRARGVRDQRSLLE